MKIGIASDHRGYQLKQKLLNELNYEIIDYGTISEESTDYPIYAFKVGEAIKNKKIDLGILICGSGIGMSIACNKVKTVRCALVNNVEDAKLCRLHNNANVIALSATNSNYKEIIDTFLTTKFSKEERHIKRVEMIDNYDN